MTQNFFSAPDCSATRREGAGFSASESASITAVLCWMSPMSSDVHSNLCSCYPPPFPRGECVPPPREACRGASSGGGSGVPFPSSRQRSPVGCKRPNWRFASISPLLQRRAPPSFQDTEPPSNASAGPSVRRSPPQSGDGLARFACISESRSSSLVPLIEKQGTIQLF